VTDEHEPATATPSPDPASPGERRLAHPPSDRYRAAEARAATDADAGDPAASVARGVAVSLVVAIVGTVAIVILGGVMALTEALLVVAGFTGGSVGVALRWGAADTLTRRHRVTLGLVVAVAAVAVGQLGLWQYARLEGGVLGPLDYLGQVYGPLVLAEFATAALLSWLATR
jgi:hypothetical protein